MEYEDATGGEWEDQLIFRAPPHVAERLWEMISKDCFDDVEFIFPEVGREGIMTLDSKIYRIWLADLPVYCESFKTTDDTHFFKSSDIAQVLCVAEGDSGTTESHQRYHLKSGLTPATKNVTKTWTKRPKDINYGEIDEKCWAALQGGEA